MKNVKLFIKEIIILSMLACTNVFAQTPISYDNVLWSPELIVSDTNQRYQNIKMQLTATGTWMVTADEQASLAAVNSVEVMGLDSYPMHPYVVIKGYLPNKCTYRDKTVQERINSTFYLVLTQKILEGLECADTIIPFTETYPLDIQDLEPGVYEVKVNNKTTSFELLNNNDNTVCCKIYCCSCSPEYSKESYLNIPKEKCKRSDHMMGGNCYEIVDPSYCAAAD